MNRLLSGVLLLLMATAVFAGEGDRLLRKAREAYAEADYWQVDFVNTFAWELAGDTVSNAGNLLLAPEGAFRVDMGGAHLLSDGNLLWRWEEGGDQVLQEKLGDNADVILPHQFLAKLEERFDPGRVTELGDDSRRIELKVKNDSVFMTDVSLVLVREDDIWQPQQIEFIDAGDNWNQYRITGRRSWAGEDLPAVLAESLRLTLPIGYELLVLDEAGE